jgi:Na+-transporting NADH:ubiquinone oxidoreductase subunit NqrE
MAGLPTREPAALPLWPMALLAGLLPLVATVLAASLSMQQGLVPACNPFWDGCTSISRAARYELPNILFRALMLPAATLQALVWVAVARWLMQCGAAGRGVAWIAPLGVVAGIALVVYGSFLGTEGLIYRWLRQYGTVAYFGFTCLNLLLTGNVVQALVRVRRLFMPRGLEHAMVALASTLVLLGVGNAIVAAAFGEPLKGRVENVTEWWGALIFVFGFCAIAAMWWRERVVLRLGVSPR